MLTRFQHTARPAGYAGYRVQGLRGCDLVHMGAAQGIGTSLSSLLLAPPRFCNFETALLPFGLHFFFYSFFLSFCSLPFINNYIFFLINSP